MVSSMNHSLILLSLFALLVCVGPSHGVDINVILIQGTSIPSPGDSTVASMPCVKKLLPCQEYLKLTATPPPPYCVLLTEMVSDDPKCLCDILNNVDILKSLNITQDDALRLPKACGANTDVSACKKNASTAPTTGSPTTPGNSSVPSENTSSSDNSTSTKNAANVVSYVAGSEFTVVFMSLIITSFF